MDIYEFLMEDYLREKEKEMAGGFDMSDLFRQLMGEGSVFSGHGMFDGMTFIQYVPEGIFLESKNITIENVVFFGKQECQVYWSDGEMTTVVCGKKDTFSEETAILMVIAKRFMKGYTTVEKALKKAEHLPSKGRLNKLMGK